jgi:hypothetical protein
MMSSNSSVSFKTEKLPSPVKPITKPRTKNVNSKEKTFSFYIYIMYFINWIVLILPFLFFPQMIVRVVLSSKGFIHVQFRHLRRVAR